MVGACRGEWVVVVPKTKRSYMIEEKNIKKIDRKAEQTHMSKSAIVNEALDEYLGVASGGDRSDGSLLQKIRGES